jgi:two-component system response regulator AtoC
VPDKLAQTIDHLHEVAGSTEPVLVVAGEGRLSTHPLDRDELSIGRAADCDVAIDHRALSRRHAVVRRSPNLALHDQGSTNGTRTLRGIIRGGEPVALELGESFHIGPYTFVVVGGTPARSAVPSHPLVVEDPLPDRVSELVREIAASSVNVLIQGETGVGKEVLAETLHDAVGAHRTSSSRINCAALVRARCSRASCSAHHKGAFTGAATSEPRRGSSKRSRAARCSSTRSASCRSASQAKLLRAVEAREILRLGSTKPIAIDVRFVAATNRELPQEVAAKRFRQDLYFRLDGITLVIPPLRDRRDRIPTLALRFFDAANKTGARLSPAVFEALHAHDWPGNVRELKAVIERGLLLARGGELGPQHLAFSPRVDAPKPRPAPALAPNLDPAPDGDIAHLTAEEQTQRQELIAALEACSGNQTRAAKLLGISRTTMVNKLALYRIPRPRPR